MALELMKKVAALQEEGVLDKDKTPEDFIKEAGLADVLRAIVSGAKGIGKDISRGGERVLAGAAEVVKKPHEWLTAPQTKVTTTMTPKGNIPKGYDSYSQKIEQVSGGVPDALKKALVIGTGVGTGLATAEALGEIPSLARRRKSLKAVMESPDIGRGQKAQARKIFEILDTYAPSLAENPLVAKSFVQGIIDYGGVLDHKTISELISAQRGMLETSPSMVDKIQTGAKALDVASGIGVA